MVAEVEQTEAVDVGEGDVKLADVTLQLVDDLLNRAPLRYVRPLERHELRLLVQYLPFLNNELRLIHVRLRLLLLVIVN